MGDKFNENRMCRVGGQKPTKRERWIAFHRLWRLAANGAGHWGDMAATDCFRVLFSDWRWISLVNADERSLSRSHLPKQVRRQILRVERKQRLYGKHYRWLDQCQAVSKKLRDDQGLEVTPDEVAEVRCKIIRLAREKAAEMNFDLPSDDDAVLRLLRRQNHEE